MNKQTHKEAYLTIDDAPSAAFKSKVDFLISKSIPAVFFCQGKLLEERFGEAVCALKRGYIIGNHSYDHPYFSDLTLAQCFGQILQTDQIIDRLYKEASLERRSRYFRFPYGDKGGLHPSDVFGPYTKEGLNRKQSIQDFLKELGYSRPHLESISYAYYLNSGLVNDVDWYWTYDVHEWSLFTPQHEHGIDNLEKVYARMEENFPEAGRGLNYYGSADLILMHDHPESNDIFEPIIERLLEKGIIFKAIGI